MLVLAAVLCASPLVAAEMRVQRDVAYVEPRSERQTLDLYAPLTGSNHPIVIWIHGGGWRQGDKRSVQQKPGAFVDKGFVFVSTNYRFVPQVTVKEMTGDVAKAIRWTHDHAQEYGGNPNSIFVMGHSAGAHLAALICTDDRYLNEEGLSLSIVKGCVPVDTAAYDIPQRFAQSDASKSSAGKAIFGESEASHKELSPITYVGQVKSIPAFLILHVADRPDSKAQSEQFAMALRSSNVTALVVPAEGKTHGTINSELGQTDDKPTKALFEFLDRQLK
jgi:acetyl esterase/lipase